MTRFLIPLRSIRNDISLVLEKGENDAAAKPPHHFPYYSAETEVILNAVRNLFRPLVTGNEGRNLEKTTISIAPRR